MQYSKLRIFLMAACALVIWLLLPSMHTLAQEKAVATLEKVSATSTTTQVYGPFPGGEQETKPFTRQKIRLDDETVPVNQSSKSTEASRVGDISQAGPSAIAAFKKIHPE